MSRQLKPRRPAVAYVRVSTQRQGRSGLGLAAQKVAIERFAKTEGFEVRAVFVEVVVTNMPVAPALQRERLAAPGRRTMWPTPR